MKNRELKQDDTFFHWAHVKELPMDKWQCFIRDVYTLFEKLPPTHNGKPLTITEKTINEENVYFCGDHPLGFEAFYLSRKRNVGGFLDSEACRTGHMPYELAVQACLLLYCYHFQRLVGIGSSANTVKQWKDAIKLVKDVFHLNAFPIKEISFHVIENHKKHC